MFSRKATKAKRSGIKTFALIIPRFEDVDHSFYAEEILKGVGLSASRLRVDVLSHVTEKHDHHDWLNSKTIDPQYINGIIFADIDNDTETLQKVIATGIPYIVLNNIFEEPINSIAVDNFKAAKEVIEYLINLGHQKIAIITGDQKTQSGRFRLDGYKEALAKHQIPVKKEYIKHGDFLRTPSRKATKELLDLPERPTAIFACSDVMALEVLAEAKARSIVVPQELSVVGFDDNPINVHSSIKLTTVSQPLKEMGRLGLEKLSLICEGKIGIPVQALLSTMLVERESVAKI
ncbi:MAG: substrate-binding domain-containing protein [Candidatus Omnitrophica bacterium]|nr:substrate-binding domain-containing protein [Candidatus Omnitrophota bacterium]